MFQQKWHWSLGITERVKAEFIAKAKIRLCNTVSDWKDKWEIYGYEGKPTELTTDVWDLFDQKAQFVLCFSKNEG